MNEEIISLLTKLNDNVETGFKDVNKRIDNVETGFKDVNKRIDKLEATVKSLEGTVKEGFTGIGKTFEEATKANNELESNLNVDIDYLKHKILQIEKDIFVLSPKH